MLLLIAAILGAVTLLAIVIGSIPAAALVYIVKNVYPVVKRISKWAARVENMISLALLALIPLALIVLLFFAGFTIIILLVPIPLILFLPLGLGVLVWLIRAIRRIYIRFRLWIIVTYLRYKTGNNRQPIRIRRNR
jgi:hypothetical protein